MATLDLVTLSEAKQSLDLTSNQNDTMLAAWITAVSLRVDEICGPVVVRTLTAETHDGGGGWISPKYLPLSSVTTIVEYDTAGAATTLTAEDHDTKPADAFLVDGEMIRRRSSGGDATFAYGRRNVLVTYVAGRYATTATVTEQFKRATLIVLAHMWRSERGAGSNTFGQDGDLIEFGPAWFIPKRAADLLGYEKRARVTIA